MYIIGQKGISYKDSVEHSQPLQIVDNPILKSFLLGNYCVYNVQALYQSLLKWIFCPHLRTSHNKIFELRVDGCWLGV